ncbi:MAG: hypothetical protein B9S33_09205 [Pedosphaera sp. Tous-C6FEB]|nr:MAG: hypothetical protein B9S33_09205 [Pedosphaera sp. Tous-C6FEB]
MNDPLSPPPTAPPPCVRWLRVVAFATVVSLLGFTTMVFAQLGQRNYDLILLLVLVTGPLVMLAWSYERMRRVCTDAARAEFRRHWTRVWLGAVGVTVLTFILLRNWRGELAAAVRWPSLLLLVWTSLLMVVYWRLYRVLLNRKLWARTAFLAASLTTVVALVYGVENWTGKRAWEATRQHYEAKGETLDFRAFHPVPMPDAENVGAHPLFKFPFTDAYRRRTPESAWSADDKALWEHLEVLSLRLNRMKWDERRFVHAELPLGTNAFRFHDLAKWRHYFHDNTNFLNEAARSGSGSALWLKTANFPVQQGATNPAVDVLFALTRLDASFALVEEALRRPRCRFAVEYEQEDVWGIRVPHLSHTLQMVRAYALRASAQCALGQTDAAFLDVQRSARLANLLKEEFFLIGLNVYVRAMGTTLGTAAEGMARHQWNDEQLVWLAATARQCDFLSGYATSMRAEAAGMAQFWSWARTHQKLGARTASGWGHEEMPYQHWFPWLPSGWYYRQQGTEAARVLEHELPAVDLQRRRFVRVAPPAPRSSELSRDNLIHIMMSPRFNHSFELRAKSAWVLGQTTVDQFIIAIALERHWLRHRAYPERLDALVPEFLDLLPHDLFDGQPMRYRREGEQGFVLWSIGFDGKDDHAGPLHFAGNQGGSVGEERGDLVWRYPQSK